MTHGIEPLLPLDIIEATFLVPEITTKLDTASLIASRARQLAKREEDLQQIHERVIRSRFASIADFERQVAHSIRDQDFKPGSLVLVLKKKIKAASNAKCHPRYFGPMVVVSRTHNGSFRLAELDGTVSKLKFTAFHIIAYHARLSKSISVTQFVDPADLVGLPSKEDL